MSPDTKVAVQVDGRTLTLTNLARSCIRRAGQQAAEVLDYYQRVAPVSSSAYAATVESSVMAPSLIISSNLALGTQAWRMSCSSASRSGGPGSSPVARK